MLTTTAQYLRNGTLYIALCMVLALNASAQQNVGILNVDGEFDSGAILTIHGHGFGEKNPPEPFFWDDFEHGAVGESIGDPVIGHYSYRGPNVVYTDQGVHSGNRSAYESVSTWFNGFSSRWSTSVTGAKFVFQSMVVKITSGSGSLDAPSAKLMRINTWDDGFHQYGHPSVRWWLPQDGSTLGHRAQNGEGAGTIVNGVGTGSGLFNDPNGEFFSVSLWGVISDVDVANGWFGREFNGQVREVRDVVTLSNAAAFTGYRNAYFIGHTNPRGSALEYWVDEAYADTTLARVTARDATREGISGSNGGQVAMQIPSVWSDGMIQIEVNTGRYPPGTELELVVWNASGFASPPFTVIVGESSVSDPPPVVTLTSPYDGANFDLGAAIPLAAEANSDTGFIDRVEFLVDNVVVATAEQAPWEATWLAIISGEHSIRARAYDDRGLNTTSPAAIIMVSDNGVGDPGPPGHILPPSFEIP